MIEPEDLEPRRNELDRNLGTYPYQTQERIMSNLGRSLLGGNEDHLLSQAKSERMKQEHQVGSFNHCFSKLLQEAYARRLELEDAQHRHVESRREQVRLQEELSMKEKVLRDTQIRNMHEMGQMKRAQEHRVD